MLQRTEISSLQYSITLEIQELLAYLCRLQMVVVAQLVRAPGCGPGGRGFETHLPPQRMEALQQCGAFSLLNTSKLLCAMRYILFSLLAAVSDRP